jgi:hypothetical protein
MKSIGKIIYSPYSHLLSSKNWAIVSCDDEIARYYRYLYIKEFPSQHKLVKPVWGAHISWIRNEYIPNLKKWKISNNEIIEYEYDSNVQTNGKFFWLKVKCDYLLDLRSQYGLNRDPKFGLHLTIGRIIL